VSQPAGPCYKRVISGRKICNGMRDCRGSNEYSRYKHDRRRLLWINFGVHFPLASELRRLRGGNKDRKGVRPAGLRVGCFASGAHQHHQRHHHQESQGTEELIGRIERTENGLQTWDLRRGQVQYSCCTVPAQNTVPPTVFMFQFRHVATMCLTSIVLGLR
jgi:hypothetical protein